jgi:hypothetical protein
VAAKTVVIAGALPAEAQPAKSSVILGVAHLRTENSGRSSHAAGLESMKGGVEDTFRYPSGHAK